MAAVRSSSLTSSEMDTYAGCPLCEIAQEYDSWQEQLAPLPQVVIISDDPNGIDWNDYYWGYDYWGDDRDKRRSIVRPLPRYITDRIPLELFEHIIGFLRWETQELCSCALVCRAWYHEAQALLFTSVFIRDRQDYEGLASYHRRHLKLGSASPSYLSRTRSLTVCGTGKGKGHDSDSTRDSYVQAIPLVLGGAMRSNLQCLEFRSCLNLPPHRDNHKRFFTHMSRFSELVHLELNDFTFHWFSHLCEMICALPSLRELELVRGSLSSGASTVVTRAGTARRISASQATRGIVRLRLEELGQSLLASLATWISTTDICEQPTHLCLLTKDSGDKPCIESVMDKLGPSLTNLTYYMRSTDRGELSNPLAHCLRLQALTLWIEANPIDSWQGIVTALHEAFSHIASPAIRTLDIMLWLGYSKGGPPASSHPDQEFWDISMEPVHDTISQPLFDSLHTVSLAIRRVSRYAARLTCDAVFTAEDMQSRMRSILQPWDKRGVLTVDCVEDGAGWDWEKDPSGGADPVLHDASNANGDSNGEGPSTSMGSGTQSSSS